MENVITEKDGWRHSGELMKGLQHQELNETCVGVDYVMLRYRYDPNPEPEWLLT